MPMPMGAEAALALHRPRVQLPSWMDEAEWGRWRRPVEEEEERSGERLGSRGRQRTARWRWRLLCHPTPAREAADAISRAAQQRPVQRSAGGGGRERRSTSLLHSALIHPLPHCNDGRGQARQACPS